MLYENDSYKKHPKKLAKTVEHFRSCVSIKLNDVKESRQL